jgi:hypothetical protein
MVLAAVRGVKSSQTDHVTLGPLAFVILAHLQLH